MTEHGQIGKQEQGGKVNLTGVVALAIRPDSRWEYVFLFLLAGPAREGTAIELRPK